MKSIAPLLLVFSLLALSAGVAGEPRQFSARDYGAKGDKTANDTEAIQRAIDAAAKESGGVVVLPKGDYLSGTLNLASNVTLRIEEGATLLASTERKDYHTGTLLLARDADNITIEGGGRVDGQATGDLGKRWGAPETAPFRTHLLAFDQCKNVIIRRVSFLNSDSWTLHLKRCDGVDISHVQILNNYRRLNSDGIDPDACTHVRINDCDIVTGDDSIVLKTTVASPCTTSSSPTAGSNRPPPR